MVVFLRSKRLLDVLSIGNQNDQLIVSWDEYSGLKQVSNETTIHFGSLKKVSTSVAIPPLLKHT
jgi:hypothetical protein